jgi:hypothetical protein
MKRVAGPVAVLRVTTHRRRGVRLRVGFVMVVRTGTHVDYEEGDAHDQSLFKVAGGNPLFSFVLVLSTRSRILTAFDLPQGEHQKKHVPLWKILSNNCVFMKMS